MAKSQENGTSIVLGPKDYKVGEVREDKERIVVKVTVELKERGCPHCGSLKLYRHGVCRPGEVLHSWNNGRRVYLEIYRYRWWCCDCGQMLLCIATRAWETLIRPAYYRVTALSLPD